MASAALDGGFKANADAAQAAATITPHHQGWVFAGNLGALQSGSISCTTTENPRYSRGRLSVKTVMESKRNDRNSAATSSFCHGVSSAQPRVSCQCPWCPLGPQTCHSPTAEQPLPPAAPWPQLRALINLPQPNTNGFLCGYSWRGAYRRKSRMLIHWEFTKESSFTPSAPRLTFSCSAHLLIFSTTALPTRRGKRPCSAAAPGSPCPSQGSGTPQQPPPCSPAPSSSTAPHLPTAEKPSGITAPQLPTIMCSYRQQ